MLLRISSAVFVHTAFQIRPTVDFDSPDRFAIDARDQWVASFGWDQRTNVSRSTSDSGSSALGRPRPAIRQSLHQQSHHRDTTLPQLDNESTALDTRAGAAGGRTG